MRRRMMPVLGADEEEERMLKPWSGLRVGATAL